MGDKNKGTSYTAECSDTVLLVEFCPFDWASHVLAIATSNRLTVSSCRFHEDDASIEGLDYRVLKEYHHDQRITALAWSPATSLLTAPSVIRLITAGLDHKVYLYGSDGEDESRKQVLGEHIDYVNALSVSTGDQVASVSDDHTCRVWSTDGSDAVCFPLMSPGVSVSWHSDQPNKLLVAEKRGLIRFFDVTSQQAVMSLDCGQAPLLSADWSPLNVLHVACVSGADYFVFDTSRSSSALENKPVHNGGGRTIRWSRAQRCLLATLGQPQSQLKVTNIQSNQVLFSREHILASGLSWHQRLPLVVVGGDHQVHFYRCEPC